MNKIIGTSLLHWSIMLFWLLFKGVPVIAQPLKEGMKLPVHVFKNVHNTNGTTIDLKDFDTRLLIFDFWATTCSGCIQSFPKIDSLQQVFKKDIQIIMVNSESPEKTRKFFSDRKIRLPRVPFIMGDTALSHFFQPDGYPYYVWVDSSFTIKHSSNTVVNTQTINAYLSDGKLLKSKRESGRTLIPPLFNSQYSKKILAYSIITKGIMGRMEPLPASVKNNAVEVHEKCLSVIELYVKAYNENGRFNFNRTCRLELNLKDTFPYVRPRNPFIAEGWKEDYTYNYMQLLPKEKQSDQYIIMKQELNRNFGLESRVEKRERLALVLTRTSASQSLATQGGTPYFTFTRTGLYDKSHEEKRVLKNYPYSLFSDYLGSWLEEKYELPFVDETGLLGNIDIEIDGKILDKLVIGDLNRELKRYGLAIHKRLAKIDVLVISQ